ncbi:hypothetical protein [Candidatus Electronema sp. JM]|uniref:hypothetical protein n=1 Tax=Candidatus Electronema sp. JM TaxID=3401571 RepID=UPI003AA99A32
MKRSVLLFSLVILFSSLSTSFAENKFVQSAKVDLDGDGKTDSIVLSGITANGSFHLKINTVSADGKFDSDPVDGFLVIDIDKQDNYKEIAVHTPGPSDDDEYLIYWYDGKSIQKMEHLSRWPEFLGNGIVYVKNWMGFWSQNNKYVLDKKNRKLYEVPQEFYAVGVEATVKESFPIYKTREYKDVVAYLKPETKMTLLVCDPSPAGKYSSWSYLVKSSSGLIGWARENQFSQKVQGLPLAD